MLDKYYFGKVDRISPEAPVPIVNIQKEESRLGGASNVANNIVSLGGHSLLCGVIGHENGSTGNDHPAYGRCPEYPGPDFKYA